MDHITHTVKLSVNYQEFQQEVHVTVHTGCVSEVAKFLNAYQP